MDKNQKHKVDIKIIEHFIVDDLQFKDIEQKIKNKCKQINFLFS